MSLESFLYGASPENLCWISRRGVAGTCLLVSPRCTETWEATRLGNPDISSVAWDAYSNQPHHLSLATFNKHTEPKRLRSPVASNPSKANATGSKLAGVKLFWCCIRKQSGLIDIAGIKPPDPAKVAYRSVSLNAAYTIVAFLVLVMTRD